MKILICDIHNHMHGFELLYGLLSNNAKLTFYVNKYKNNELDTMFPSNRQSDIFINKLHSSTYFLWILWRGRKYDYINVATGPEGSHISDIISVLYTLFSN